MELWRAFWIALWNGLLEVLPIPAFGHFEILKELMTDRSDAFKMVIRFSCVGVLGAIVCFFRNDIVKLLKKESRGNLFRILLMGLPSVVLFCLLEGKFPGFFYQLAVVAIAMLIQSLIMLSFPQLAELAKKKAKKHARLNGGTALVSGLLGSISILPGFSRIAILSMAARLYGQKREEAIKMAILANIPVLIAMIGKCLCYGGIDFIGVNFGIVIFSVIIAFLSAIAGLVLLRKVEKKHDSLRVFGWYQLVLALVVLVFELIK